MAGRCFSSEALIKKQFGRMIIRPTLCLRKAWGTRPKLGYLVAVALLFKKITTFDQTVVLMLFAIVVDQIASLRERSYRAANEGDSASNCGQKKRVALK